MQQPGTPSSGVGGLFIFPNLSQFCLVGSVAPKGEQSCVSSSGTEPTARSVPERMAIVCFGLLQQDPSSSRASLQEPFVAGGFAIGQSTREVFFQDLPQPQRVLANPRLGTSKGQGLGQGLPGTEIWGWCCPKKLPWEPQSEQIQTFTFSSERSCN